jgi:hypothetical protein
VIQHSTNLEHKRSWRNVSKRRAFFSHLALSACIVAFVLALVFFLWYPAPYSDAVGTWSIVRILIGVDLVLGPLLTLIVFRPAKPHLLFDVSFIALVQAAALTYGVTVLYQERPYYVVFAVDRFHVLARKDVPLNDESDTAWIQKPTIGPLYVAALLPQDTPTMQRLLEETVFGGGPDIEQRPEFWAPYAENAAKIGQRARPLADLRSRGAATTAAVDDALARFQIDPDDVGFLPMISAKLETTALVRIADGVIVAIIDINPWNSS